MLSTAHNDMLMDRHHVTVYRTKIEAARVVAKIEDDDAEWDYEVRPTDSGAGFVIRVYDEDGKALGVL